MKNFNQYRETQIKTASPGKLLLMLYDGAVRFLNVAIKALNPEDKNLEKAHIHIIKVQNIVTELTVTLDLEKGGEIAENLKELYTFLKKHLIKANLEKEPKYLEEVKGLIEQLRDAWREVVDKEENQSKDNNKENKPMKSVNFKG